MPVLTAPTGTVEQLGTREVLRSTVDKLAFYLENNAAIDAVIEAPESTGTATADAPARGLGRPAAVLRVVGSDAMWSPEEAEPAGPGGVGRAQRAGENGAARAP